MDHGCKRPYNNVQLNLRYGVTKRNSSVQNNKARDFSDLMASNSDLQPSELLVFMWAFLEPF